MVTNDTTWGAYYPKVDEDAQTHTCFQFKDPFWIEDEGCYSEIHLFLNIIICINLNNEQYYYYKLWKNIFTDPWPIGDTFYIFRKPKILKKKLYN